MGRRIREVERGVEGGRCGDAAAVWLRTDFEPEGRSGEDTDEDAGLGDGEGGIMCASSGEAELKGRVSVKTEDRVEGAMEGGRVVTREEKRSTSEEVGPRKEGEATILGRLRLDEADAEVGGRRPIEVGLGEAGRERSEELFLRELGVDDLRGATPPLEGAARRGSATVVTRKQVDRSS
jgi:hypothetical protein